MLPLCFGKRLAFTPASQGIQALGSSVGVCIDSGNDCFWPKAPIRYGSVYKLVASTTSHVTSAALGLWQILLFRGGLYWSVLNFICGPQLEDESRNLTSSSLGTSICATSSNGQHG